ncbi:hypothetical protein MalM25_25120 [Planctomycetes bacterium MalM25]|nr:hypothetical protein MalM25_25120 [Planctomycetes bacterium MalM25]
MDLLLESPLAVGALGLLLITLAAIVYTQTGTRGSQGLLALAVLLTVGAIALERSYLTPRERVRRTIGELFRAVESNDLASVLALIHPDATQMRADAGVLMPMFQVEAAGEGGEVTVELPADPTAEGAIATATLKPIIKVQHLQTGATAAYFDDLDLELVRRGDRWLLNGYQPAEDWREGAAKLGN